MRELAILQLLTIDGAMQGPSSPEEDTSGGFNRGGWARGCWDEVMEVVMKTSMADPYDLLLGRSTYDMFAEAFADASPDNALAKKLNAATKYVVTSRPLSRPWEKTIALTGDPVEEIERLKRQDGPLLQIHGSWQLVTTLLSHDLIDEFRLWTFPAVVGSGKRLFADGAMPAQMKLTDSTSTPNGATMKIYERVKTE